MSSPPSAVALALAALLGVAPLGCGSGPEVPPPPASPAGAPAATPAPTMSDQPITRLLSTPTSALTTPAERVVRDDAAWRAAWRELHGDPAAGEPPVVDFATDMVVLLALGQRSTGGYAIRVDEVAPQGSGAVVRYTVTSPGASCMTAQQLTAPVDVVRVPRVSGELRFERRAVTEEC